MAKKTFVVDGILADRLLVPALSREGLTLFNLPADRTGIERTAQNTVDSRDYAKIVFNNVAASGEDILGNVGDALPVLKLALEAGQAALAAEISGLAVGAFEMTLGYLKERKQFGKLIGQFQALQHRAADLWCQSEVTASTIINAGRQLDAGSADASLAVSLAKARAIETAKAAVIEGVQMHGGIGMTDEFDMGFYMKRARVATEWLGDYGYHAEKVAALRGF